MLLFGRLDAEKGWTKQLHLGARRNTNTRRFREARAGHGLRFDRRLAAGRTRWRRYLDRLDQENALPKIDPLQPESRRQLRVRDDDRQLSRTAAIAGKIQFGSGWWFLDQKEGMEWQMNALSNCGLLSRFVGMLTDSRSLHVLPAARILPAGALQSLRPGYGSGRASPATRIGGTDDPEHLLRECEELPTPRRSLRRLPGGASTRTGSSRTTGGCLVSFIQAGVGHGPEVLHTSGDFDQYDHSDKCNQRNEKAVICQILTRFFFIK